MSTENQQHNVVATRVFALEQMLDKLDASLKVSA